MLYYNDIFYYNKGYKVKVQDTVGAGDSFLAFLIDGLLRNVPPQKVIDIATAIGALVVSKKGANPIITNLQIKEMIQE